MDSHIPSEIAQLIQKYCDNETYVRTRRINKNFYNQDSERIYYYNNNNNNHELPRMITKIQVGKDIKHWKLRGLVHLTYLDLEMTTVMGNGSVQDLVNLTHLKLGNNRITETCLLKFPKLTHLWTGSQPMFNESIAKKMKSLTHLTVTKWDKFYINNLGFIPNLKYLDILSCNRKKHVSPDKQMSIHNSGTLNIYLENVEILKINNNKFSIKSMSLSGLKELYITKDESFQLPNTKVILLLCK